MKYILELPEKSPETPYTFDGLVCAILNAVPLERELDKIRAEIIELEGNCRLSIDEYPSCKQCTNYVFGTIYEILDKFWAEMEGKE